MSIHYLSSSVSVYEIESFIVVSPQCLDFDFLQNQSFSFARKLSLFCSINLLYLPFFFIVIRNVGCFK